MLKKVLVLLITLALPVVIYLFLKGFGKNRYDVPVYHTMSEADCEVGADNIIMTFSSIAGGGVDHDIKALPKYKIISFIIGRSEQRGNKDYILNLTRSYDAFIDQEDIAFITIAMPGEHQAQGVVSFTAERDAVIPDSEKWFIHNPKEQISIEAFLICGLGFHVEDMDPSYKMVLVDKQDRVRGYYNGLDDEETERMILETRILIDNEYNQ